ncbi:MAG: hypothetical protein Q8L64_03875 [bacterium]|nr:hypothetical protein [bacterium]
MDPRMQTSFIPKKPIVASPRMGDTSAPINLLSLLATVLLIVAVALSGGVYFYKNILIKQIEADKVFLEQAREAFEPEAINSIVRLDSRIETAKKLFASHVAVTPLFDFLSSITLPSVRFRDFSFSYVSPTEITVSMRGQAQSYATVALQSDVFNRQTKGLSGTIVSDMALDPSGLVNFSVTTKVNPSLVSYKTSISAPVSASPSTQTQ